MGTKYLPVGSVLVLLLNPVFAESNSVAEMFQQGRTSLDIRYRVEEVSQDNALKDATASTIRTRLGFETDVYRQFNAFIEFEDIHSVGDDDYNSTTNGNTEFSAILDPESTEPNQAYLNYQWGSTRLRYGRQRMALDNQRFIGNNGWRQNEQTIDGLTVMNTAFEGSRIIYAYMSGVQRIFGEDSPIGELDMDSHLLNYRYQQLNGNSLTAYGYFLEMEKPALSARSNKTVGLRYKASFDAVGMKWLYTLEYAEQSDYADGASIIDAEYSLLEFGVKNSNQWVTKIAVETLGGDGTYALQTPLATVDAFNGYADIFAAITPPDGLVDQYLSLSGPFLGLQFDLSYHRFRSDNDNIDYGDEWDFQLTKRFDEHYLIGLKFAAYAADDFAVDTDKLWAWVEVTF
ncbi:MAG: alginate export family protein [bacterium]